MSKVVSYCQNVKYETGYFLWNEIRLWKDQKTSLQQIWSKVTIYWVNIHTLNDQLLEQNWKVIKGTTDPCIAEFLNPINTFHVFCQLFRFHELSTALTAMKVVLSCHKCDNFAILTRLQSKSLIIPYFWWSNAVNYLKLFFSVFDCPDPCDLDLSIE